MSTGIAGPQSPDLDKAAMIVPEDDGKIGCYVKLGLPKKLCAQLKKEAADRGCLGLSEYLRYLIISSPRRPIAGDLDDTEIASAHRLLFVLHRMGEELNKPNSLFQSKKIG